MPMENALPNFARLQRVFRSLTCAQKAWPMMDSDPLSKGFPFQLDDLWHRGGLTLEPIDVEFQDADSELDGAIKGVEKYDLTIPPLDVTGTIDEHSLSSISSGDQSAAEEASSAGDDAADAAPDIWAAETELEPLRVPTTWQSWEAFEGKDDAAVEGPSCLSEAGPDTLTVALDRLRPRDTGSGVLPQSVVLRALGSLVVGRSSICYQWNAVKLAFEPTVQNVPTSGLSLALQDSLVLGLLDCGSKFRILLEHGQSRANKHECPAVVAFQGCVADILDSIESHVSVESHKVVSVLQLQRLTDRPHQILNVLAQLSRSIEGCSTDEAVIAALSDEVFDIVSVDDTFANVVQVVLSRVSAPWLEGFSADLSLDDIGGASVYDLDVNTTDSALKATGGSPQDQSLDRQAHAHQVRFLEAGDISLMRETRATLKMLRLHLTSEQLSSLQLIEPATFETSPNHVSSSENRSMLHTGSSLLAVNEAPSSFSDDCRRISKCHISTQTTTNSANHDSAVWVGEDEQAEYLMSLQHCMSRPISLPVAGPLANAVSRILEDSETSDHGRDNPADVAPFHKEFDLLKTIRPRIQSIAAGANKALLRHLFGELKLEPHLDLCRRFFLFGDGDFVARLAAAFFDQETQSAERKRGNVPTTQQMGLRLGTGKCERWPPASSEIQLTLMGILAETNPCESHDRARSQHRLDGLDAISFSIRELSESDIDKVSDSLSIYALDFLKLQYTPPALLDSILPAALMRSYDDVFRLLLKMLRLVHITTRLKTTVCTRPACRDSKASKDFALRAQFAIETHHCISVLFSHFLGAGIRVPWEKFTAALHDIRMTAEGDGFLDRTGGNTALKQILQRHTTCLDTIKARLFLRQKQGQIYASVEGVLKTVLSCAASLEDVREAVAGESIALLRESLGLLVRSIQVAIDRRRYETSMDRNAEQEVDAMRMLVARLNWNGFYTEPS